ncbi:nucleotidyl transferase AbiEii/AbiGii toxin family protein [Propionicicella superfundia]|uniref:nucleotidyl transferase AbiEii/AbiGii toxin family protein n=1 Tax=Propionicicella superfundia TaxID=348582 RepID=UPI00041C81BF|nr:nucleotidyl transferase AbiEii/AbiGii toxin family protein [Propionicicella superfundia]
MKEIHERLARIGLREAEEYGFVLAGGYAISANGMGDRPSMDVDLFTDRFEPDRFAEAAQRVRAALGEAGFDVEDKTVGRTFVDMHVVDRATGESSDIQLGANYREFPPARIEIGPVLDVRDAVAGKMSALWSRGEVRDFIDIDTVVTSGRFTRAEVLAIGDQQEALPMDRRMLTQRFEMLRDPRYAAKYHPIEFAKYGVGETARVAIVERFTQWATEIDPARAAEGTSAEATRERTGTEPTGGHAGLPTARAAFPDKARGAVGAPRSPHAGPTAAHRPPEYDRGHGTER